MAREREEHCHKDTSTVDPLISGFPTTGRLSESMVKELQSPILKLFSVRLMHISCCEPVEMSWKQANHSDTLSVLISCAHFQLELTM